MVPVGATQASLIVRSCEDTPAYSKKSRVSAGRSDLMLALPQGAGPDASSSAAVGLQVAQ